ncbi:MAG: hypothetical protein KDG52_01335 [Rhodocyclaceae bacterium]|nr:hypothetical protein [Rhodocyclaceae bacterium]
MALPAGEGPGNAWLVEIAHTNVTELFAGFGARGTSAEAVADRLARTVRHYRDGTAAVGEHLADQLALPMALAGGGRFTATRFSSHLQTNLAVIRKFLPIDASAARRDDGWQVRIEACQEVLRKAPGPHSCPPAPSALGPACRPLGECEIPIARRPQKKRPESP